MRQALGRCSGHTRAETTSVADMPAAERRAAARSVHTPSTCLQPCSHSMLRSTRSMLWLLLTASWWLVALMGLGFSAGGSVCSMGVVWERVGARDCHERVSL